MAEEFCPGGYKSLLAYPDKIKFGLQPSDLETGCEFKDWFFE
jgi:hypothetical protein